MPRKKLGQLLVEAGLIDEMQLQSALGRHRQWGSPLGQTLVDMGFLDESTLVRALSSQLNIPGVDLDTAQISPQALALLDHDFCSTHSCLPFGYEPKGPFLDVAMSDPTNPEVFDLIRVRTRCNIRPHIAAPRSISAAVRRSYMGQGMDLEQELSPTWGARPDEVVYPDRSRAAPPAAVGREPTPAPGSLREDISGPGIPIEMPDLTEPAPLAPAPPAAGQPARRPRHPTPASGQASSGGSRDQLLVQLHETVKRLAANLERDELVIRKLMALLVERGVCTRTELIAKIYEE